MFIKLENWIVNLPNIEMFPIQMPFFFFMVSWVSLCYILNVDEGLIQMAFLKKKHGLLLLDYI